MCFTSKIRYVILLLGLTTGTGYAQNLQLVIPGDFADPSIIRKGNQYYAIGTSSEWAPHFPLFTSSNLKDWKQSGYVFEQTPEWTGGSFWAPEYYYHKGTYFVYYSARRKSDGVSCIGVATSTHPDRGFTDHGVLIEHGKEAIDAYVFNDNGQLYITWKAYGLDGRPIEIVGKKLSDDGLSLVGELFTLMRDDQGIGMEGQSILKQGDYYYLFYSVGACCGAQCDYNVRVARAKSLQGPYEDYDANPILAENEWWKCSGHGTFVKDAEGRDFYLYHAYQKASDVFTGRQGLLAKLEWDEQSGWPAFKDPGFATDGSVDAGIRQDFSTKKATNFWQWDFRNSTPAFKQQKGNLHLSGTSKEGNLAGIALTVRPYTAQYEISTEVVNQNDALKGLVIYGDANAAMGIGVKGNEIHFWVVRDNERTVLGSSAPADLFSPLQLKMVVSPDFTCRVYWKQGQAAWQEISHENKPYAINFLPQWDRSPRPGLHYSGSPEQEAQFNFFEMH